jgi:hypothetical protein
MRDALARVHQGTSRRACAEKENIVSLSNAVIPAVLVRPSDARLRAISTERDLAYESFLDGGPELVVVGRDVSDAHVDAAAAKWLPRYGLTADAVREFRDQAH